MDTPVPGGTTVRAELTAAWEHSGSRTAYAKLFDGPRCPEHLLYYVGHAHNLRGRSGDGMNGASLVRWSELAAYQQQTHWVFRVYERELLMAIDALMRNVANEQHRANAPRTTHAADDGGAA